MRPMRSWQHESIKRFVSALVLGVAISVVGSIAIMSTPGAQWEQLFGLRWLFAVRGPVPSPDSVVVIAIDEKSATDFGLPANPRAWPRTLHAELSRYMVKAGTRIVAFDLTFDTPSAQPEHDEQFADAIRSAGNVLLAQSIRRDTISLARSDGRPGESAVVETRNPPLHVLEMAALGSAPFLLPKGSRVDLYWPFLDDTQATPTLPVLTFRSYLKALRSDGEAVAGPSSDDRREPILPDPAFTAPIQFLNFYGPPRTIETVSYSDVLRAARASDPPGPVADARFKGKAVFVGYAAATPSGQDRLRDDYRTVFSQGNGLDLSGVEIAATAFANLVDKRALQPLAIAQQLGIVAVWGLALGAICRLIRPIFAAPTVAALATGYLALVQLGFSKAALWMPLMTPIALQVPLALFAGVWLNYRDTKREREAIKRAFGFFLPPGVVDRLTRNLGPMPDSNRVVFGACLSTDVEKYTTLAEITEPARLGELMNDYYVELFVPVERSSGVIADVVGDSMMAVWAKSAKGPDVRRSACLAALEIAAAVERFNATGNGRPALPTRFGLASGDMLFGTVGASGHYEYRAVGDIVNTASRIQGLNKVLGTRVLASGETVRGLDDVVTRPLGSFLLVGKAKPVSIVELLGLRHSVDHDLLERCARFAAALEAFTTRRWHDAAAGFIELLKSHPGDGAARFYAAQCQRLLAEPADEDWSPTIRISTK
jgi:adenylate cyclase